MSIQETEQGVFGQDLAVHIPTPMEVIQSAIQSDVPPETLRELMALKREMEADEAAKAHADAIVKFQSKCPPIHKGRKVPGMGSYAAYEDIKKIIQPLLTECGISLGYSFSYEGDTIIATCSVTVGTHTRDNTVPVHLPKGMGQINDSQKSGVAISYAKRYAMCAALDIVVTDEDTDAGGLGETITEEQAIKLSEMFEGFDDPDTERAQFLERWAHVESIRDLPAAKYDSAVSAVKRKLGSVKR